MQVYFVTCIWKTRIKQVYISYFYGIKVYPAVVPTAHHKVIDSWCYSTSRLYTRIFNFQELFFFLFNGQLVISVNYLTWQCRLRGCCIVWKEESTLNATIQVATAKGLRMANEDSYIMWEATSCLVVQNLKQRT